MSPDFTLDDFREQFDQIEKTGAKDATRRMPGMSEMALEAETPEESVKRVRRMLDAMTPEERHDPDRIDDAARLRIATTAGTEPEDVTQLLSQFAQVRDLMRQLAGLSFWQRLKLVLGFGKMPKSGDD
jgi:signal recognition particle subunit SRP54